MGVKCFMIERTGQMKRWLRRYVLQLEGETTEQYDALRKCDVPGNHGYHQTFVELDVIEEKVEADGCVHDTGENVPHDDPRWKNVCACGFVFRDEDNWQIFVDSLYTRKDTGDVFRLRDAPPGAMWYGDWLPKNMYWDNKEDDNLFVMLPDHTDWCIDSRCNNCALPDDRTHRCWGRSGTPPNISAGKIGATCPAGGGSVKTPRFHGFLTNGEITCTGDSEVKC
jgi:hypothetical protein